jgi:hypothetical protein
VLVDDGLFHDNLDVFKGLTLIDGFFHFFHDNLDVFKGLTLIDGFFHFFHDNLDVFKGFCFPSIIDELVCVFLWSMTFFLTRNFWQL